MKKLLVYLIVVTGVSLHATAPGKLCIILDYGQSEEQLRKCFSGSQIHESGGRTSRIGAITNALITALHQKASPLLVSRSLLTSIIARKRIFEDCLTLTVAQLSEKYRKSITCSPSLAYFKQHCLYADRMYKQINQELKKLLAQGTQEEIDKALNTLTTKKQYLEDAAPRSLQKYTGTQRGPRESMHHEVQSYALCAYAPLDEYCIKEVSSELTLLLPHVDKNGCKQIPGLQKITPYEKELGLKVNHLPDITDRSVLLKERPIVYKVPLAQHLEEIFVTTQEGSKHSWTLYISGHGLPEYYERRKSRQLSSLHSFYERQLKKNHPEKTQKELNQRLERITTGMKKNEKRLSMMPDNHEHIICSVPVEEFQKVLQFLNSRIKTSLLYYTTCFGGGIHLDTPYKKGTQPLTYTYDIIVGSISDTVSIQDTPMLLLPPYRSTLRKGTFTSEGISPCSLDTKNKCLVPHSSLRFGTFFGEAVKYIRDYLQLACHLHPYVQSDGAVIHHELENGAHVRKAGAQTFSLLGSPHTFCHARNKTTQVPKRAEVLLLEQEQYDSLTLEGSIKITLSMVPGTVAHTIKTMHAPKTTFGQLISSLYAFPMLSSSKLFWIEKLEVLPNTWPSFLAQPLQGSTLYNVILLRNITTSDTLKHRVRNGLYFSDEKGTTWFCPINKKVGKAVRTSRSLAHGELKELFSKIKTHL